MGVSLEVSISGGAATKPQNQGLDLSVAVANYDANVTSGASRPAVIGDHLCVYKYNANEFQIFSLATPASPTPMGTLVVEKNVSTYAWFVQSAKRTAALAAVLFVGDQIPWPQNGVLGITLMPDSGNLSVISDTKSDGSIRMITILTDPKYGCSFIRP